MSIYYNPEVTCWARNTDSDDKVIDPLVDVVLWMGSKPLQWDQDGGLRVVPIKHGDNTNVRFEDLYSQLKDIILFVDEALPKKTTAGDRPDPAAIGRLRFVRNLGRALTMRVVLAGTAATKANMIADDPNAESRNVAGELAWIECRFLWKTMSENDVKGVVLPNIALPNDLQQALISELARSRPYLVHLFGRVMKLKRIQQHYIKSDYLLAVLEEVGKELAIEKGMSDASNLAYLTAVWLQLGHIPPTAFRIKPADLVRGHYFEPCVVVDKEGNIACGFPWEERSVTPAPLRVKIFCQLASTAKKIMWHVSTTATNGKRQAAFCWDFSGVEYALTACVQQCLAREPLLAVAISTQCSMTKAKFRGALPMLYQETPQQLNVDEADGELNEHILFALLQLASNCEKLTRTRVSLDIFLQKIADYLRIDSGESFADGVEEFCGKLEDYGEPELSRDILDVLLGEDQRNNIFTIDDQTKENFKTCTMSWLVPACSYEALKDTVAEAASLFDGTDIAGLVPGGRNVAFDAAAYSWKKMTAPKDVLVLPDWVFEFKTRSQPGYNIDRALDDLKRKCLSQQENPVSEPENQERLLASEQPDERDCQEPKKKKPKKQRVRDKPDGLKCHAMIIATTGGRANCCKIVYSDDTRKYLRVAMVVGHGR